jgi:hypothetical protein
MDAHLGAPLYGSTSVKAEDVPGPERVLAEALPLARQNAKERGQGRALGFQSGRISCGPSGSFGTGETYVDKVFMTKAPGTF